jgi:branched-chain amino acid transport system permease protein
MDWDIIIGQAVGQGIGIQAIIFALAAIGLNVHFGYTGLLNFGQAGFLAIGAYALGVTVATFGQSLWLGVIFGLLASVVFALLLGVPTLRLRADYLAIVTIAAAEIIRLTVRSVTFRKTFGGSDGINSFADEFYALNPFTSGVAVGPVSFSRDELWMTVVGWSLVAISLLLVFLSMRSPWGRVLKGIREDEDAVRSLGKNVFAYKIQALIFGGIMGTLGGFVFALSNQSVQPDNYSPAITFFAWAVLILGGAARVFGPVLGSIIFWFLMIFLNVALSEAVRAGYITIISATQVSQIRFILLGLALMLLMVFRPQGILGDRKELALDAR